MGGKQRLSKLPKAKYEGQCDYFHYENWSFLRFGLISYMNDVQRNRG